MRLRLHAEPCEKLNASMRTASGAAGTSSFATSAPTDTTPVGQRTHGERGDFIGRIRKRSHGPFHDGRGGFKGTVFERVGLGTGTAAEQRSSDGKEQ